MREFFSYYVRDGRADTTIHSHHDSHRFRYLPSCAIGSRPSKTSMGQQQRALAPFASKTFSEPPPPRLPLFALLDALLSLLRSVTTRRALLELLGDRRLAHVYQGHRQHHHLRSEPESQPVSQSVRVVEIVPQDWSAAAIGGFWLAVGGWWLVLGPGIPPRRSRCPGGDRAARSPRSSSQRATWS